MTAGADKKVVVDGMSEDPAIMKLCNKTEHTVRNVVESLTTTASKNVQLSVLERAEIVNETDGATSESSNLDKSDRKVITATAEWNGGIHLSPRLETPA